MMTADEMHEEFLKIKKEHAQMYEALKGLFYISHGLDTQNRYVLRMKMGEFNKIKSLLKEIENES